MRSARGGFGARLLLSQLVVVVVGASTLLIVALGLAPGLFRSHVESAVGPVTAELAAHLDMAFARAVLVSLAVATTTSTLAALAVGLFVTRRAVRPIEELAGAAAAVAAGNYSVRVPETGFGSELATLSSAFNQMAEDVAGTERTRAEMLRDLAHDLRTPLTSVRGYHEAIADGVLPADRATFSRLDAELSRLERLVDDLGSVSRAEERRLDVHLRPVLVADLVTGAADSAALSYPGTGVTVRMEPATDGSQVRVDLDRLHEALANLVTNAVQHTPAGGTVTLRSRTAGSWVQIEVADTGVGITAEHLPHIFDRFYRVGDGRSRDSGGSGIGLTIARALVEAQGGHVRVHSPGAGQGTTFVVSLPLREHARPDGQAPPTALPPAPAGSPATAEDPTT